MKTEKLSVRVSVAMLNRVIFPHPQDKTPTLALERKATVLDGGEKIRVQAQPFGGGVRIINPTSLQKIVGDIRFDSECSKHERDFRILIPPLKWDAVKQYCLYHLENFNDPDLESTPDRELIEEFEDTLHVELDPNQYTVQSMGFVIENQPVPTDNMEVRGRPTVRVYRIFEVQIIDNELCKAMLDISGRYSDQDLGILAMKDFQNGNRGWENSIQTLPLELVIQSYLALQPEMRYRKITIENHILDESVLAILENVDVPQHQRV